MEGNPPPCKEDETGVCWDSALRLLQSDTANSVPTTRHVLSVPCTSPSREGVH